MKKNILTYFTIAFLVIACKDGSQNKTEDAGLNDTIVQASSEEIATQNIDDCKEGESLVFEGETLASYTEDRMRGQGVISFSMNINDRLTILNEDDTQFGEIVLNEDMTFFTLTMPKKIVARKVISNFDFAAFDFDAENTTADKEYLLIYVNKEKKKVKKTDLKFTFSTWEDYVKKETIKLKTCNLLPDAKGKDVTFDVVEVKGDEIKIKSTKDCGGEDAPFENLKGNIKWKSGQTLLIDFAVCN